jgi:hypothetical protein
MAMLISFCGFALVPAVTVVAVINVVSRPSNHLSYTKLGILALVPCLSTLTKLQL